mmetsp:Transcript_85895/g.277380  ORF Transcript_85895/g.277380 Transcript_85895/m.277380 type:complete len:240 (+) Transcript_85895:81-800(+)
MYAVPISGQGAATRACPLAHCKCSQLPMQEATLAFHRQALCETATSDDFSQTRSREALDMDLSRHPAPGCPPRPTPLRRRRRGHRPAQRLVPRRRLVGVDVEVGAVVVVESLRVGHPRRGRGGRIQVVVHDGRCRRRPRREQGQACGRLRCMLGRSIRDASGTEAGGATALGKCKKSGVDLIEPEPADVVGHTTRSRAIARVLLGRAGALGNVIGPSTSARAVVRGAGAGKGRDVDGGP